MSLYDDNRNYILQNCQWMLVLEDLLKSFRIISLLLRIVNEHDSPPLPASAYSPSVMDCNDRRSIQIISFEFIQYFRLLLLRNNGTLGHPM